MRLVFHTNSISAHQLPLARELVRQLGADNYRYVYTGDALQRGGQEIAEYDPWIIKQSADPTVDRLLATADVLISGLREMELFEARAKSGLKTFYCGERWFKPIPLFDIRMAGCSVPVCFPGVCRMFVPSYRRMTHRFVRWLTTDPNGRCLAIGPWSKKDMLRIGVPASKIVDWGYFVDSGEKEGIEQPRSDDGSPLKVLWVGRMLDWKRVDTIVRAVARANEAAVRGVPGEDRRRDFCSLTLVGDGPERMRLERLSKRLQIQQCTFLPPVPIGRVRELMRQHDVYVLSSNAQEGWGAALNEAMEEGMTCFGTYEAGASAAMLPESHLFHTGDDRRLAALLGQCAFYSDAPAARRAGGAFVPIPPACTPKGAADILMESLA